MLDFRSAERRRWLGQFLGQFIGEVRRTAGNPWGWAFGFKGPAPGRTHVDVIIKCRDSPSEYVLLVDSVHSAGRRWWDLQRGNSSPKRNRLDQCLLGSKESQKTVYFVADS